MIDLPEILKRMEDMNLSKIAEKIGVTKQALSKIKLRETNPSYTTLKKLSEYFEEKDKVIKG